MPEKKHDKDDETARLIEITRRFRIGMLETIATDGHLHGRPMAVIDVDENEHAIWFMTRRDGEACTEIANDPRAMVTLQDEDAFVQWSGHARVVEDPAKARALWSPALSPWFPDETDAAEIALVRVDADVGEYWDRRGTLRGRALVRRGKGAIRKELVGASEAAPTDHGRVRFDGPGRG